RTGRWNFRVRCAQRRARRVAQSGSTRSKDLFLSRYMKNDKSHPSSESTIVNRRAVLRGAAAGALAGMALEPASPPDRSGTPKPAESPNLNPPVVQVAGGKLRGFRDGKTSTFLGIPYAEAERFGMPKAVTPWEGVKSAQTWGPVSPIPAQERAGGDDF